MKTPAFQFYPQDFLSSPDVQMMTTQEVGAYCLLLFNSWIISDNPGYLPNNDKKLQRLSKLNAEEWQDVKEVVLEKFAKSDCGNFIYNKRLVSEAFKQEQRRERLAKNGQKGGRPPKANDNQEETNEEPKNNLQVSETKPTDNLNERLSSSSSSSSSELKDSASAPLNFKLEIETEKPKKTKAPKQPKKEEPKDAGWPEWVDAYYKFLQKRLGTKPLLNKSDFAGLRDIRQQLQEGNEKDDSKALSEFLYILQHWARLENYHQNRVKAVQINSELLNIQLQIRKATGRVTGTSKILDEPPQQMTTEEVNDLFLMKPDDTVYTPKFKFST